MSIRVSCSCGHQFQVKDTYAGKSGRCPKCQQTLKVPDIVEAAAKPRTTSKPAVAVAAPPASAKAMDAERLRVAREVHQGLIPQATPDLAAFELAGMCQATAAVGGDYFDYIPLPDGSLGVAIGDASGHGLGAALMMSQARICLRSLGQAYADVGTIFTLANRVFSGALPEDYYATLTMARLDLNTRLLTYASAGHPTSYVFDAAGNVKWRLESTDCPLGLLPHSMYGTSSPLRLEPGELVLLLTNGLLKVRGADGSPLGPQRLLDAVGNNCRQPASSVIEAIRRAAMAHLQGRPPDDDLTAVVIKAR